MKPSLAPGIRHSRSVTVSDAMTVPALYPESETFRAMPPVFATGFMVGFMEWACLEAMAPHLDSNEGSVGVHVDVSHTAATPVGMCVTADVELESIEGRLAWFRVVLRDDVDVIGEGRHQRAVIDKAKFLEKARLKAPEAT